MGYFGEALADQTQATGFASRCTKDLIEEEIFFHRRDLFSGGVDPPALWDPQLLHRSQ